MRLRADNSRVPFKLAVPAGLWATQVARPPIAFVRSLTSTLHSIVLHLEHPDLSAFPAHLRVLTTFSYSALIKQTSSPTPTSMRRPA